MTRPCVRALQPTSPDLPLSSKKTPLPAALYRRPRPPTEPKSGQSPPTSTGTSSEGSSPSLRVLPVAPTATELPDRFGISTRFVVVVRVTQIADEQMQFSTGHAYPADRLTFRPTMKRRLQTPGDLLTLTKFKTFISASLFRTILNIIKPSVHRDCLRSGNRIVRLRFDELSARVTVTTCGKDLILCSQVNSVFDSVSIDHRVAVEIAQKPCGSGFGNRLMGFSERWKETQHATAPVITGR